ncbi:two-component sensor histidine kinase [Veronia nyctiphanis]|nr:two-component sensor histidine kinase [Veronia nyctiphanis]
MTQSLNTSQQRVVDSQGLAFWKNWRGIAFRLGFAFALLSFTTLSLALFSSFTFSRVDSALVELKETDIPTLEQAARLNDIVRALITDSALLIEVDSSLERQHLITRITDNIDDMRRAMETFPEYHAYFKDLFSQVINSLSLLHQSIEESQALSGELTQLMEGFFPLLKSASEELDQLTDREKTRVNFSQLKALLYYQLGLIEKWNSDRSFNELDDTSYQLEDIGSQWLALWQQSGLASTRPTLDEKLSLIYRLASRSSRLFQLKNEVLEWHYQQEYFLQTSRDYLNQLSIQIETNTVNVNLEIDRSIALAQQSLASNITLSFFLSLVSIALAAGIAWFYVRKSILERLLQLNQDMFAISTGRLDIHVATKGQDEVTQMAKSLTVFQATAKAVKRTNEQLEAEVEERKAAEEKLKVTQNELVQAGKLAALGQLSVGITHEINQPLTAVNSHVRSASKWLEQGRPERAAQNLTKIERMLHKVAALTHHLKAYSRKSDGKVTATLVLPVVKDAIELFANRNVPITLACAVPEARR